MSRMRYFSKEMIFIFIFSFLIERKDKIEDLYNIVSNLESNNHTWRHAVLYTTNPFHTEGQRLSS